MIALLWGACVNPAFFETGAPPPFGYVAEGPSVVAARTVPPFAAPGDEVVVEALVLGAPERIEVDGCAWSLDRPARSCFDVPAFWEPLGSELPLTVTLPTWTTDGFEDCDDRSTWLEADTGLWRPGQCWNTVHVQVRALRSDGTEATATATPRVVVGDRPAALPPLAPLEVTLPSTATPSQTVSVEVRMPLPKDLIDDPLTDWFSARTQWFVQGGELLGTGHTRFRVLDEALLSENRWTVPDAPGAYTIAAVVRPVRGPNRIFNDVTWGTATVEVAP